MPSSSVLRAQVEAEVHGADTVGQSPRGDDVDTGGGDLADRGQGDIAAGLDESASGDELDALAQLGRGEVVEHDDVGPALEHGRDLVEPVDLDLDRRRVRQPGPRGTDRLADLVALAGQDGEVVVLDHDRVRESEAVIVPAAGDDG